MRPPIDGRTVVVQPRHPEDDVEADECERDEVEVIGVRADPKRCRGHERPGRLSASVGEGDESTARLLHGGEAVTRDERRRDEVAGGAAVNEYDGGSAEERARQLDERASGMSEAVGVTSGGRRRRGEREELRDDDESGKGRGVGVGRRPAGRGGIRYGYDLLGWPYQFDGTGLNAFVQSFATWPCSLHLRHTFFSRHLM